MSGTTTQKVIGASARSKAANDKRIAKEETALMPHVERMKKQKVKAIIKLADAVFFMYSQQLCQMPKALGRRKIFQLLIACRIGGSFWMRVSGHGPQLSGLNRVSKYPDRDYTCVTHPYCAHCTMNLDNIDGI